MRAGAAWPRMPISISRPERARFRRNVGHADIFLQKRRRAAAGDAARFASRQRHRIAVAPDALVEHLEAHQLALDAGSAFARASTSLPRKRPFSSLQIQPRPASSGVVVSSISCP